jgi:hypothetical protein
VNKPHPPSKKLWRRKKMKEEIVDIPLSQEVIKRGYIKIPASISKKYKIGPGDLLILRIERIVRKGENDEGIVDE